MKLPLPSLRFGFLKPTSVRGQLTLQYTLVFSVILVLAAGLLYAVLTWIIYWNIDSELQDEANFVKQYIQFDAKDQPILAVAGATDSGDLNAIFRLAQISDASGHLVKQSPELKGLGFSLEPGELKRILVERPTFTTHGWPREEEIRFANAVLRGPKNQPYLLQIGARLKPINDALATFLWVMLMLLPVTVVISAVAGSVMGKRTLKPVADVTRAAQLITASNLSQRIPVTGGDELAELAQTCNAMIARLEASFQQMNEFAANVSHELRTPLQAIQGETELALVSQAPLAECRRVLESNLEEIDRLNRMIRNLLVLAQADAGQVQPRLEAMDLNELVRDLVEQMQVVAAARNIGLRAVTSAPVPLRADSLRLRQMMLNLIDNALKYTPPGGRIEVRVERHPGRARVQVRDTGVGIEAEDLPHIFERFYRADKSRSRGGAGAPDGCGLGLPMVKWVAELHHGNVEVASIPGQGTSFTVNLPLAGVA